MCTDLSATFRLLTISLIFCFGGCAPKVRQAHDGPIKRFPIFSGQSAVIVSLEPDEPFLTLRDQSKQDQLKILQLDIDGVPIQNYLPPLSALKVQDGIRNQERSVEYHLTGETDKLKMSLEWNPSANQFLVLLTIEAKEQISIEGYSSIFVFVKDGNPVVPFGSDNNSIDLTLESGAIVKASYEVNAYEGAEPKLSKTRLKVTGSEGADFANQLALRLITNKFSQAASPFGMSSNRYQRHIFWDAECWMFPSLVLTDPDMARLIADFRVKTWEQAKENYRLWKQAGYPVANKHKHQPLEELISLMPEIAPAMYPWETDLTGRELSPTETKFEHHITGDVAWMIDQAMAFGLVEREVGEKIIKSCAAFYLHRLAKNPDGSYGILDTVSPSEWHVVDNDLYTNAIADWTIRRALGEKAWPLGKIKLVRDGDTFLTFEGDKLLQYQQSAALLTLFPLEYPPAEAEKWALYERFAGKAAKEGPAMSAAIDSIVAARLRKTQEAFTHWQNSWQPYTINPHLEFREKPVGQSYFLTGAYASQNAILYGFLGLRIQSKQPKDTWYIELDPTHFLVCFPALPDEWEEIRLEHTKIRGKVYTITGTHDGVEVTRE